MPIKQQFQLLFLTITATLLNSCGTITNSITNSSSIDRDSRTYQAPKNYSEHRAQQKLFATSDGNYAFTDHGDKLAKNTIVMLHGVPTNSWKYRKLISSLQHTNRVISIDLLGFGSSSKPTTQGPHYSPANQAKNVRSLLSAIGVTKHNLMMHDMGGLVAWEMLRQDSSSISNLLVLNTIITHNGFEHPKMKSGNITKLITRAYSLPLSSSAVLKTTFNHMGLTGADKLDSKNCSGYVTPMKEGSDAALYAFFTSLNTDLYNKLDSYQSDFKKFQGKTLVLWGAQDKNLTPKQIPYLAKHLRIPSANIHVYPDASHLLTEEIPEEITQQVQKFLN